MSYLVDTHCHLHDREFFEPTQAEAMVARAAANGVRRLICIGTDVADSRQAREFAMRHMNVEWTYGVHPEYATQTEGCDCAKELDRLIAEGEAQTGVNGPQTQTETNDAQVEASGKASARHAKPPIAIGEVGLDYHVEGYDRSAQIRLLNEMLQLALDRGLPVSFHIREAYDDFFPVVANFPGLTGVVHCFTDNKRNLRRILEETGFYVAVNGLATYATLPTPPLSRILLETDAPFLTPVPFRGIINESAYIRNIAEWLVAKLGVTFELIEHETTKNAENLFRFRDPVIRAPGRV